MASPKQVTLASLLKNKTVFGVKTMYTFTYERTDFILYASFKKRKIKSSSGTQPLFIIGV